MAALTTGLLGCREPDPSPQRPEKPAASSSASAQPTARDAPGTPRPPASLGSAIPSPERNPLTPAGVALGRRLFYDPIVSSSNHVACATCHRQELAFSDGARLSNSGVSGKTLLRHTPALINLAFQDRYFWDGGATDLESQAFAPIRHADEMGQNLGRLREELAALTPYPELFAKAFADGLTLPNIVRALAQFQRTLLSGGSRYDKHVAGQPGGELSEVERRGLAIFEANCSTCHRGSHFTDHGYRNNGLDSAYGDENEELAWGRGRITRDPADKGKFKTPTLRNVMVTAPYMHDGRFATLDAVLAHYRGGVKDSPTLDPLLRRKAGRLGLPLDDGEAAALIAFLYTLTDEAFLHDPALGPPESAGR